MGVECGEDIILHVEEIQIRLMPTLNRVRLI